MMESLRRLKALSDPGRLKVLALVDAAGEICVCKIEEALTMPQSTVSRHLNRLKEAGWLTDRRAGRWVHYRLADFPDSPWREILVRLLSDTEVAEVVPDAENYPHNNHGNDAACD